MTALWMRDLAAWFAQSTLLIASAGLLAAALRLTEPRALLASWRTILVVCLALPLCQSWRTRDAASPAVDAPPGISASVAAPAPPPATPVWPAADELILGLVAAGIIVRGARLALGASNLRRLRRGATPLEPCPPAVRAAERRVGVSAELLVSDRVSGPVTFGARRPVVVLPPAVLDLDAGVQEAIVCHELLHVRRRDWLEEIAEEAVRTVFWFHPAVRWLVGRIQLSREQVVDRAVIELTSSRERYVDALLAVALAQIRPVLSPAPLFLRRRLLKTRIAALFQESPMTSRRLIVSLAGAAAALAFVAVLSIRVFPLEASGQPSGGPVQIVTGGEHLLHASMPEYPSRAIERRVEGDVIVELSVDDRGAVSDAHVLSGPEELRRAVLEAVLGWHFAPASLHSTITQATIRFRLPGPGEVGERGAAWKVEAKVGELTPGQRAEHEIMEIQQALRDPALNDSQKAELKQKMEAVQAQLAKIRAEREQAGEAFTVTRRAEASFERPAVLTQIRTERVPDAALADLTGKLGIHIGDQISEARAKQIRAAVTGVDEHLRASFRGDGKGGVVLVIVAQ